ncbi:MAG: T9SS type A sorting domain-containing protein [Candidatus Zixiibacteriota bacterium]|nr:MAG: T9SS type A sorting domain-containing protein [candidate division Zixibacteria bacterium]
MNRTLKSAILLLTLFVLGTVATAFADSNWVPLNGANGAQKPSAVVLTSNESETVIRFSVYGFWSREVVEDGVTYQALKFPGYATILDIGKPALPVISEMVGIPGSANVSVSVIDYKEQVLSGYNVYPFQTPLLETQEREQFDIDRALYQQDAFYPTVQATTGEPGIWRDLRIVNLRVSPLTFNPVTGEIKAFSEITVRLEYTGTSDVNVKSAPAHPVPKNYDRMYEKAVLNYSDIRADLRENVSFDGDMDAPYDYLIIAEDAYISNMQPFVDWKISQGLATNIVPVSTVGTTVTAVKNYIASEYNASGISYVLFVGDEGDIPGYTGYGFFSDYYYSLLEGNDDYADIAIGRFCVTRSDQLDNMVSKTVTYEYSPPAGDWLTKSLLVANWEYAPDKYQLCSEQIRLATDLPDSNYSILYPDFTTAYGAAFEDGGDEASNADVVNYINEGFRLVNYRGHGDNTIWWYWNVYGEHFEISDANAINNGQFTPVVLGIACYTGNLAYNGTTLAEAFTQGDDAAVAYLGATDPSYTYPNHDYDKQIYAAIFDEGVNAIGDATNESTVRTIALWGSLGITNARMYLWLGDPSLQLIWNGPFGPPPPVLLSPDDGAYFDDPAQVLLDWDDVVEAVSYHVQIDDNADFSSPVGDQEGVTATEWTTPVLDQNIYYWRVQSHDGEQYGMWSEARRIYVGIYVEAPTLYSPADGAKIKNGLNIPLEWYALTGVAGYDIEIDDNPDFSSPERTGFSNDCSGGICVYYIDPPLRNATYYWRVRATDEGWPWSDVWSFKMTGRVRTDSPELDQGVPTEITCQNYPNPFNPVTGISFGLPKASRVKLEVFNILGQKHTTLVDGVLSAGYHTYVWDGSKAASGVYFYRLTTEEKQITKSMLLVK